MDWINLIVGTAIGFFVSIIANIYTDKYKDWMARRTIDTKNKRVSELKKDLERFSEYKEAPIKFYFVIVRNLFLALLTTQVLIFATFLLSAEPTLRNTDVFMKQLIPFWLITPDSLVVSMRFIALAMIIALFATSFYNFNSTMKDIKIFVDFEEFKKAVNKRIEKLS